MAEYAIFNDPHFSDRPPSACTDTYQDDMFALLAAIGDLAWERELRAVICAGDWFHHKTPGRTTFATVIRTIEILRRFPCPVYVVAGNHDMQNDRLDSIDRTQPLGALLASGALQLLHGWMAPTADHDFNGWLDPIYGVPWLQRFTDETVSTALADYRDLPADNPHQLVVTHAPLYPLGKELPYENYPADRWAQAMGNTGNVHYGHVHSPHGIHTAAGVTFCNPGALSRGSLDEHNLSRPVQIALWESDTGEFTLHTLPHKPAAEVFRLAEAQQARTATAEFGVFRDVVGTARIGVISVESVMEHVRALPIKADVKDTVLKLLEDNA